MHRTPFGGSLELKIHIFWLYGIECYMEGWGDDPPLHCDMETVPGAKIVHLKRVCIYLSIYIYPNKYHIQYKVSTASNQ